MKSTIGAVLIVCLALLITISIMLLGLSLNVNLGDSVDPSLTNGLLTATAILFGFISLEARDIKQFGVRVFLIMTLIGFLLVTGMFYFNAMISVGHATKLAALVVFGDFYFCTLCSLGVLFIRQLTEKEKESES